jgi:uncharacterized membrane protein YeaQ/YmgE (transglycosylase-associated protein family)
MKIYFQKDRLEAFLTTKGDTRWIIAFVIICVLAGLCGSYLLGKYFGLLVVMLLGIVGILLAAAAYALLNYRTKIDETTVVPITSGWDYRPTANRRSTAIHKATAETAEGLGSSARNENDYVWFNALECSADTLVETSPDVAMARDNCAPAASPDIVYRADSIGDRALSTYDQSPIDNQTAVAE